MRKMNSAMTQALFVALLLPKALVSSAFFDSTLEDCQLMQSVSEGLLAADLPENCPVRGYECASNDFCGDCSWGPYLAAMGCADGCGYCDLDEGVCVGRIAAMSIAKGWISGSDFVVTTYTISLTYRLAADNYDTEYEGFYFDIDPTGFYRTTCTAKFLGTACALCELRYCDNQQTTTGYYMDCTNIEGGAIVDYCNPPVVDDYKDSNLSFMEKLLLVPAYVCSLADTNDVSATNTIAAEPNTNVAVMDPPPAGSGNGVSVNTNNNNNGANNSSDAADKLTTGAITAMIVFTVAFFLSF